MKKLYSFLSLLLLFNLIELITSLKKGQIRLYEQEDFNGYNHILSVDYAPDGTTIINNLKTYSSQSGFNSTALSVEIGPWTVARFINSAKSTRDFVTDSRNLMKDVVGNINQIIIQTYDQYLSSDPDCIILFDDDYFEEDTLSPYELCVDPDDPSKVYDLSEIDIGTGFTWNSNIRSILNPYGLIVRHYYNTDDEYYVDFDGSHGNFLVLNGEMTDTVINPWEISSVEEDGSDHYGGALQFIPRNATTIPPDCVRLFSQRIIGYGESVDICKDTDLRSVGRFIHDSDSVADWDWEDYAKSIELGENIQNYTFFKSQGNTDDLFTDPTYTRYTNSCFAELTNEYYADNSGDSVADEHRFISLNHFDSTTKTPVLDNKLSPMGKNCFYMEMIDYLSNSEAEYIIIHFNTFEEALDFRFNRYWDHRDMTGLIRCRDGRERYYNLENFSWSSSGFNKYPVGRYSPYVSQHLRYERKIYNPGDYDGSSPKFDIHFIHVKYFDTYELEANDNNGMWNSRTRRAKEYQNNLLHDSSLTYIHYEPDKDFKSKYPTPPKLRTYTRVRNYERNGDWTVYLP